MIEHITYDINNTNSNNIYDWILKQTSKYYKKYNVNPDIIEMGKDVYSNLLEFYKKHRIKVTDKSRINGCKIKVNIELPSYDIIMRQDEEGRKKFMDMSLKIERETFIDRLLYIFPSELEEIKRMAEKNSKQIDDGIEYIHNEVEFEIFYEDVWLKNKKEK